MTDDNSHWSESADYLTKFSNEYLKTISPITRNQAAIIRNQIADILNMPQEDLSKIIAAFSKE
jgi:Mn-dependent DtxR family transcriptional regulator